MTDTSPASASARGFTLDFDVTSGDTVLIPAGTTVAVRKPDSGELRGTTINALLNGDVTAVLLVAPRITTPAIQKGARLDPADLTQLAGEIADFLLPSSAKASLPMT